MASHAGFAFDRRRREQQGRCMQSIRERLLEFFAQHIHPNREAYDRELAEKRRRGEAWQPSSVVERLKPVARAAGLWNLFLPRSERSPEGLRNVEYAALCEIMGH